MNTLVGRRVTDFTAKQTSTGTLEINGSVTDWQHGADDPRLLCHVALVCDVGDDDARTIKRLVTSPQLSEAGSFEGAALFGGFRSSIRALPSSQSRVMSLFVLLLYELPIMAIISQAGSPETSSSPIVPGQCAGMVTGGAIDVRRRSGRPGFEIGSLDPYESCSELWADIPIPRAPMVRRRRLIDVHTRTEESALVDLKAWFQDSLLLAAGTAPIHEYEIEAVLDLEKDLIVWIRAVPGALPAPECPYAASSVDTLIGSTLSTVDAYISTAMRGSATCTHLNDAVKGLAGVAGLVTDSGE